MKLAAITFTLLFLALQYVFWFGSGSVFSAWKLQHQIAKKAQVNAKLKQRNNAIRADITDLKSGNQAIEERARSELGMVKKGETFYQIARHDK